VFDDVGFDREASVASPHRRSGGREPLPPFDLPRFAQFCRGKSR
jgi:hypothetical protein